jgi:hypothetical protein
MDPVRSTSPILRSSDVSNATEADDRSDIRSIQKVYLGFSGLGNARRIFVGTATCVALLLSMRLGMVCAA